MLPVLCTDSPLIMIFISALTERKDQYWLPVCLKPIFIGIYWICDNVPRSTAF